MGKATARIPACLGRIFQNGFITYRHLLCSLRSNHSEKISTVINKHEHFLDVFKANRKWPMTVASQEASSVILPHVAAWQPTTILAMCFHPKCTVCTKGTRADASVTKHSRLHWEVKWQIQVARRNINSFRTSEQRASCQGGGGSPSTELTSDMTDALNTRARQLILCVWFCEFILTCSCVSDQSLLLFIFIIIFVGLHLFGYDKCYQLPVQADLRKPG